MSIFTMYYTEKNTKIVDEVMEKITGGLYEISYRNVNNCAHGLYTDTSTTNTVSDYMQYFSNILQMKEDFTSVSDLVLEKPYFDISAKFIDDDIIVIISMYNSVNYEKAELIIENLHNFSNIFKGDYESATEIFNYDPLNSLKMDVLISLDTSSSMEDSINSVKDSMFNSFIKAMQRYNIDWNVTVVCSSSIYYLYVAYNEKTLKDLLDRYNIDITPGGSTNIVNTAHFVATTNGREQMKKRDGVPMTVITVTDDYEQPSLGLLQSEPEYLTGSNILLDKYQYYFKRNGITVNGIYPLNGQGAAGAKYYRPADFHNKIVTDSGGFKCNIYDYGRGYDIFMDNIARTMSAQSTNIKLSNKNIVPNSIKVTQGSVLMNNTDWRYDENENSIVIIPSGSSSPRENVEIRVTYDYIN